MPSLSRCLAGIVPVPVPVTVTVTVSHYQCLTTISLSQSLSVSRWLAVTVTLSHNSLIQSVSWQRLGCPGLTVIVTVTVTVTVNVIVRMPRRYCSFASLSLRLSAAVGELTGAVFAELRVLSGSVFPTA